VKSTPLRRPASTTLLARLIETPDLVRAVRELPAPTFSALVRHVGVEDAGEIVALATTDQIVAAFDEDLFANESPGEREVFDGERFASWLEVLLEAGDDAAAGRMAELSEDFVVRAFSSLILVLDHDALRGRMSESDESACYADKAIESRLSEEIDGYLLISKRYAGWDALLALILAMDRDHRALLARVLDRCAVMAKDCLDDLDALTGMLTSEEALAEDVEAEREERRSKLGYVEPRAARSFLALARMPPTGNIASLQRDPITRAYFRDLAPPSSAALETCQGPPRSLDLIGGMGGIEPALPARPGGTRASSDAAAAFIDAMRLLSKADLQCYGERMEELAYLANVLMAGARIGDGRLRRSEAAEAVLSTVAFGAELEARERRSDRSCSTVRATAAELCVVLRACAADLLFRKASAMLTARKARITSTGFLLSRADLHAAIGQMDNC
jgi:hypothetical protein